MPLLSSFLGSYSESLVLQQAPAQDTVPSPWQEQEA